MVTKVGTTIPTIARAAAATVSPTFAGDQPRTRGNRLIARVYCFGGAALTSTDGTWAPVAADAISGTARGNIFTKVAQGNDAAPTFTSVGASRMEAGLDEYTPCILWPSSVGVAGILTGTQLLVAMPIVVPLPGGITVTMYGGHFAVVAVNNFSNLSPGVFGAERSRLYNRQGQRAYSPLLAERPSPWLSGGWYQVSDNGHMGGDYHLSPDVGVADQQLILIDQIITSNFLAMIAFFYEGAVEPDLFASLGRVGPRAF